MSKNKRWKREAKRIYGECCNVMNDVLIANCNTCKYVKMCFSERLNWCGKFCGIRELERRCKIVTDINIGIVNKKR